MSQVGREIVLRAEEISYTRGHAFKFARQQHHAMGRGARFDVSRTTSRVIMFFVDGIYMSSQNEIN